MKISVIVPCYQAERYIQRCLQSICSQTYSNLEIIVVDDGSTDASASIVKELAQSDSRIKYLYQLNAGVSAARNAGIDYASGDVITFVDSDDTIKSHMYETLIDLMQKYHADISHCSYCRVLENGEIKKTILPRPGYFDSMLTECGPPAIMTKDGIILFYNGKNDALNGDKAYTANTYCAGQILFDKKNPYKVLDRLDDPFYKPEADFEKSGQYPAGTVFIEGLVPFKGKWYLYYGCADSFVAVAVRDHQ